MRGAIKYGIPTSVGIGTAGYAASQDEDLGSTGLAGIAGGLGAYAGLKGARAAAPELAGRFAGLFAGPKAQGAVDRLTTYADNLNAKKGITRDASGYTVAEPRDPYHYAKSGRGPSKKSVLRGDRSFRANRAEDLAEMLTQAATMGTNPNFLSGTKYAAAAGLVPASALTAGLGGVAAGAIPGALGVPGFTGIDPESYGSSNSPGARYKASTAQYS
jgi:hypothetical protein